MRDDGRGRGAGAQPRGHGASRASDSVELEFVATTDRENLEDQLAYLSDEIRLPEANEISLRLLRHQASSVRHQKYHGIDIVTVVVEGSR